jgi:hypothetical protein
MSQEIVSVIMLLLFAAIVGFDIYLDNSKGNNTFSSRFRALGRWWPPSRLLVTLGIGILLGHFWWTPQDVHDAGGSACCACPKTATDAGPAPALSSPELPSPAKTP